ncbi:JAB domain-containing protein [Pedobacter sp. 22163]|uniref:JAB domain-containing protein n=1 Tax=Pedobacter sp. 22163 TaxID=3453883 RepID=UPI003F858F51
MRTQKNQIALTELKFSYQALKRPLDVSKAKFSFKLLKRISGKPLPNYENECYVLFVNEKRHVFSWYKLQDFGIVGNYIQQIVGLALACNAYGIVILKYNDERPLFIDSVNELFVSTCFDACEKMKIDIIDYIICNPKTYLSYRKQCLKD